jgi:hypothetical protein
VTEALVVMEGSVTAKVAADPAVTVAVVVVNDGAVDVDESISNESVFESVPSDPSTEMVEIPAEVICDAVTVAVSCVALT